MTNPPSVSASKKYDVSSEVSSEVTDNSETVHTPKTTESSGFRSIDELIETEKNFYDVLQRALRDYHDVLQKKNIVDEEFLKIVFSGIPKLLI
eukprot:Awhi_evm1s8244